MGMAGRVIGLGVGVGVVVCAWVGAVGGADEKGKSGVDSGAARAAGAGRHFEERIAPLLARHCLECHDPSTKKGKLDLSRKSAALAGGKKGKGIVPGKAGESLVWKRVESDEMPEDRPALSAAEKKLLKEWIDGGAVWPGEVIDPLAHQRDGRSAQISLRRLTVAEYIETVRSAVGVDVEEEARLVLPRDLRADGFSNTAYNLNIDLAHVEAYARLAEIIVGRMDVAKFAGRFSKSQEISDGAMRELIGSMGKWLLRGPLEEREVSAFCAVAAAVAGEKGDFKKAVGCVIEAMLQSPRFVYRIEKQVPPPQPSPGVPEEGEEREGSSRRVDGYELASRLSYIVWGGPPDAELMRAADAEELGERGRVEAQVRRMLKDPRAVEQSKRFMHDWLNLDRLENLRPDREHFPQWDSRLANDMREETLAFFEEVAWKQKRPMWELLNAEVTFATPRLAAHYGLKERREPAGGTEGLEALYTFAESRGDMVRDKSGAKEALDLKIEKASLVTWERGGLSTDASALIMTAKPPRRLLEKIIKSNALSLEAWVTPADARQSGPARILTLSSGPSQRNFTLGQDGDKFEVRLRSGRTDGNGMPALSSPAGTAAARPTHVVYTRDAAGKARLYVNGDRVAERDVGGDLAKWDRGFRLGIGNESSKDRAWRGTFHLVAIYSRALKAEEISAHGKGLSRYELAGVPARGGLLTQGSVLTIGGDEASMVARGLFVLKDLLYSGVGSPPPGVDSTPKPTKPGLSQRVMAEARLADKSCAGCHSRFEPLAFGLEKFDGIGRHREKDRHGNGLREDGEILFPGEEKAVRYKTSAELMDLLAGSGRVRMNITRKLAQFALGRPLVDADTEAIEKIHAAAAKNGGSYAELMTAIVMSDLVLTARTESAR